MRGYLYYAQEDANLNAKFIRMLQEEAYAQQIDLQLVYTENFLKHSPSVDFVWNRSRSAAVAKHYEQQGILVFNNSKTNEIANNKQLAIEFVRALNIQTVPIFSKLSSIENFPVVLKTVDGHGGHEVMLCYSMEELNAKKALFKNRETIVQPFIESNAEDVRVWMLGNEVLGAVLRTGNDNFKSNYTIGGTISKFKLSDVLLNSVQQITNALNSNYIGIDFIKGIDNQYYFNEIEDPVGARSYYDLFGHDLPKKLISLIKQELC